MVSQFESQNDVKIKKPRKEVNDRKSMVRNLFLKFLGRQTVINKKITNQPENQIIDIPIQKPKEIVIPQTPGKFLSYSSRFVLEEILEKKLKAKKNARIIIWTIAYPSLLAAMTKKTNDIINKKNDVSFVNRLIAIDNVILCMINVTKFLFFPKQIQKFLLLNLKKFIDSVIQFTL